MAKIKVELTARDFIELEWTDNHEVLEFEMIGCARFLEVFHGLKAQYGKDISRWQLPPGDDHVAMLLRELILKTRQAWYFPYTQDELCHCRNVSRKLVDETVISGAHSTEEISRLTMAGTGCGTCRPHISKIIAYRLSNSSSST